MDRHLMGWSIVVGLVLVLISLGRWSIHKVKTSKNRAAYAGLLLLIGPFFPVDPPPEPKAEQVIKDESEDDPIDQAIP
jgi:hypothetical protein